MAPRDTKAGRLKSDPQAMVAAIRKVILDHPPGTGINELARLCLAEGIPISKQQIAQVRRQLPKLVHTAHIDSIGALGTVLNDLSKERPGSLVNLSQLKEVLDTTYDAALVDQAKTVAPPAGLLIHGMQLRMAENQRTERERKLAAQEAREKRWAARVAAEQIEPDAVLVPPLAISPPRQLEALTQPEPWQKNTVQKDGEIVAQNEVVAPKTPKEDLTELARQACNIMKAHQLTELLLTIENGKAKWHYQVSRSDEGEISF